MPTPATTLVTKPVAIIGAAPSVARPGVLQGGLVDTRRVELLGGLVERLRRSRC